MLIQSQQVARTSCKLFANPHSIHQAGKCLQRTPRTALRQPNHITVRHATHAAQGRANVQNKSHGKRMGAKKTGEQYVIPGNIIFRQRGTLWHPGENVARGRDHTIYATEAGYVKYYRNPRLHPKRQYIGVTFNRDDKLPYPANAARRRRFGMVASPRPPPAPFEDLDAPEEVAGSALGTIPNPTGVGISVAQAAVSSPSSTTSPSTKAERKRLATGRIDATSLQMQSNYSFRESNYSIGRIADRAGIVAPAFKPGNRFAAWRKREKRKEAAKARRMVSRAAKGGQKAKRAGKNK